MANFGGFGDVLGALALFLGTHSVPALPSLRAGFVRVLGRRGYIVLHSLVATGALVWLIAATLEAPYLELWGFHPWAVWVPLLVMPLACILLVAGLTTPNPFSLGPGGRGFDPTRPGIVAVTRHPVLWGGALWAGAHLFPNGEVRAVLLFGFLGAFSLMGTVLFDRRRAAQMGEGLWRRMVAPTSNLPLQALLAGRAGLGDWRGLAWRSAAGLALYVAILLAHGPMFGYYPVQW